jgi:hypothetical protein
MNKSQAQTLLRHYSLGLIKFSRHCSERMIERDVTTNDILQVLMWGEVVELTEDREFGNWKCKVKGTDTDGNELFIHAAINEDDHSVLFITIY